MALKCGGQQKNNENFNFVFEIIFQRKNILTFDFTSKFFLGVIRNENSLCVQANTVLKICFFVCFFFLIIKVYPLVVVMSASIFYSAPCCRNSSATSS